MALPAVIYLYPNNTQALQVQGLQDVTTGNFLDAALVTATLFDQRGQQDTVLANLSLTYMPGSNGNYQGTIPQSFSPPAFTGLSPLGGFLLQITAIQGGVQAVFSIPVILRLRSQQ